jgi:putative transport protein
MISLLQQNMLLAFFFVIATGFAIGRIRFVGMQLGSSAVLFVGLAVGYWVPGLEIPNFIPQLGLVIFIYALGLSNGANFFRTLRQRENRQVEFMLLVLLLPALLLLGAALLLPFSAPNIAGIFAGATTNTAALAAVIDLLNVAAAPDSVNGVLAAAVIGYSLSYPAGVLCRVIALLLAERIWRIDYAAEAHALRTIYPVGQEIINRAIEINQPAVLSRPLRELYREYDWEDILFGRLYRGEEMELSSGESTFKSGDVIVVVGTTESVEGATAVLGRDAGEEIVSDQSIYVKRRLFVSNSEVVGRPIAALDLREKYGALVTRVRRGDVDLVANRKTVLELGDRVRVMARRTEMPHVVDLFGDSYVSVSQVNLLPFGIGLVAGLLLGMITFTLPGGISFQMGFAGGPLIIALLLGALYRTGPVVWTLPYSANQTLQQIGLVLLLAGIGIRSGETLATSMINESVLLILLVAVGLVFADMIFGLLVGYRLFKIPFALLSGLLASQPAVLNIMSERAGNPLPQIGFSTMLPISIIVRVVLAQILLLLLI